MLIAHLIFLSLSSGIFARPTVEDQIDFINDDTNANVVAYVPEPVEQNNGITSEDDTNANVVAYVPGPAENEPVEQNNGFTISQAGAAPVEQAPTGPPPAPGCTTNYPYLMTCGGPEVQVSEETKEILNCVPGTKKSITKWGRFLKTSAVAHLCCEGDTPWGPFHLVPHCSYMKDSPTLEQWTNLQYFQFTQGTYKYPSSR